MRFSNSATRTKLVIAQNSDWLTDLFTSLDTLFLRWIHKMSYQGKLTRPELSLHGFFMNISVLKLATSKVVKDGKITSFNGRMSSKIWKMAREKVYLVIHDFLAPLGLIINYRQWSAFTEMVFVVKIKYFVD